MFHLCDNGENVRWRSKAYGVAAAVGWLVDGGVGASPTTICPGLLTAISAMPREFVLMSPVTQTHFPVNATSGASLNRARVGSSITMAQLCLGKGRSMFKYVRFRREPLRYFALAIVPHTVLVSPRCW